MSYLVIELAAGLANATFIKDKYGDNLIFDTRKEAMKVVAECKEGVLFDSDYRPEPTAFGFDANDLREHSGIALTDEEAEAALMWMLTKGSVDDGWDNVGNALEATLEDYDARVDEAERREEEDEGKIFITLS